MMESKPHGLLVPDIYVIHAIRALEAGNSVRVDICWEERKPDDANLIAITPVEAATKARLQ